MDLFVDSLCSEYILWFVTRQFEKMKKLFLVNTWKSSRCHVQDAVFKMPCSRCHGFVWIITDRDRVSALFLAIDCVVNSSWNWLSCETLEILASSKIRMKLRCLDKRSRLERARFSRNHSRNSPNALSMKALLNSQNSQENNSDGVFFSRRDMLLQ